MDTSDYTIDKSILFKITYADKEITIQLHPAYNTVGDLKEEIFLRLDIPISKQVIDCWYKNPESDNDTLGLCCALDVNYLIVKSKDEMDLFTATTTDGSTAQTSNNTEPFTTHENSAAMDFVEHFSNNFNDEGIMFHFCNLEQAIADTFITPLEKKKILLLYFHNKNAEFSTIFGQNVTTPEVKALIQKKFYLLGWNVENETYHTALIKALNKHSEFSDLTVMIESKQCCALLIVPIRNSFIIHSCLRNKVSTRDFLKTLQAAEEFLSAENVPDLAKAVESPDDMGSTNYQQLMLDLLGDRDYDSFEFDEHDRLKEKIGFALFGPPQSETGYDEKQNKKIQSLYEVIVKENNLLAKWKDRVIISFIYNCIEPLPSEKNKRAKKYKDYNPNTDLSPVPLFVFPKCKNCENPCRVFIDDVGRVYQSWNEYLTKNKLDECEMILPLCGRYQADDNGKVLLERHLSPSCGIDSKILFGADIASTVGGLVSGGVFLAAAIPAITVAPAALIAAGAAGLGVGVYSIGRSIHTLVDRTKHKESLSFANSEARGAYLNIVAGSLGFVGAGANMAVSQLAAKGFQIGQGATATVNVINVANIGASGIGVVNSSYDVVDQWLTENRSPSLLTIVQLSSSVLFFGHAVYNFKTAGAIIEESQTQTLRDYQDSLRSNRHRKTFNKMMKETIRQNDGNVQQGRAQVIKTVRNIQNKDEAFATLTRLNKKMNENQVRFSADNGGISLNGVPIDLAKFGSMDRSQVVTFLQSLPSTPTPHEVAIMTSRLQISFEGVSNVDINKIALNLATIFGKSKGSITQKIINTVATLIQDMLLGAALPNALKQRFEEVFPGFERYLRLFKMVNEFFQALINPLEEEYQKYQKTKNPNYEHPLFFTLAKDYSERMGQLFDFVSKGYFIATRPTQALIRELINYFYTWFSKQLCDYEERRERRKQRESHSGASAKKSKCPVCGGEYYSHAS